MNTDPSYVTTAQLRAAYDALGFDPDLFDSTRTIRLDPHCVVAVRYLRNESGNRYLAADGEAATEAIVAEVVDSTPHS